MKEKDDNDWNNYTIEYLYQIIESYKKKENDFFFNQDDIDYWRGELDFKNNIHPNAKAIYDIAYLLKPSSILEVGCGGCYHLKALSQLLEDSDIYGCDISPQQISFGMWFSELPQRVLDNLFIMNFAKHKPDRQYEMIFTNAVVMHQSTDNALKMMENMRDASSKYVLMIENPNHHNKWYDMMKLVFHKGWSFYTHDRYTHHSYLWTRK